MGQQEFPFEPVFTPPLLFSLNSFLDDLHISPDTKQLADDLAMQLIVVVFSWADSVQIVLFQVFTQFAKVALSV
jgi:hypothetical protein